MQHAVPNDILIPEMTRLLQEGHTVRFTPKGISMRPFIEGDRDSVLLRRLDRPACVGDILLCRVQQTMQNKGQNVPSCGDDASRVVSTDNPDNAIPHSSFLIPHYVLHRVLRIEDGGQRIVLMGDGNLRGEETCTPADIIGIVVRIETPHGRRKPLTRARLWQRLLPCRPFLLKIYRKIYKCISSAAGE